MDPVNDARTSVILGLLAIAPVLLLAVFLGSLAVGRRVAMPIERARQRQLAFTADASHELRTPLSVIEANASLALAAERDTAWYRHAFERVQAESTRMRRLVEELLWLARFDAMQRPPQHEPVDLGVLVDQAADRFAARPRHARCRSRSATRPRESRCRHRPNGSTSSSGCCSTTPAATRRSAGACWSVSLPPIGASCSPSMTAGRASPRTVGAASSTASTAAPSEPGGAGLGLAIADAIVRATSGRWHIGTSPQGGARMSVSWPMTGSGQGGS